MHPDVVLGITGGDKNPNAISRRGGSRLTPRVIPKRVVVDVREFMSSLPSILYQQGLELVPLTLEVRYLFPSVSHARTTYGSPDCCSYQHTAS